MAFIGLQCVQSLGMGLDRGRSLAMLVMGDTRLSQEINPQSLVTTRTPGSVPGGSLLCDQPHMHCVFVQAVPEAGGQPGVRTPAPLSHTASRFPSMLVYIQGGAWVLTGSFEFLWCPVPETFFCLTKPGFAF